MVGVGPEKVSLDIHHGQQVKISGVLLQRVDPASNIVGFGSWFDGGAMSDRWALVSLPDVLRVINSRPLT